MIGDICFINLVGKDLDGNYTYEFLFTPNSDTFWGTDFEYKPCGLCNGLVPFDDEDSTLYIIKTTIKLDLIQNSLCFGFQDCVDGIVAMAYENIDDLEEYPQNGRLVIHFGESFEEVEEKLAEHNIIMVKKEENGTLSE